MPKADPSFAKIDKAKEERMEVKRYARIKGEEKQKEKRGNTGGKKKVKTEKKKRKKEQGGSVECHQELPWRPL